MDLPPGTRIDRYTILSLAGKGGMGEVYRARDPRLGREVAIKILPQRFASDAGALARFEREAKAVAALSHPNILAIFDIGSDQDVPYAVMELLEGETLRDRIHDSALPWRKAVEIGIAVAEGLAAAHSKGVIHRDVKPENIFLTSADRVKILDFGLARLKPVVSQQDLTAAPTKSIETAMGVIQGTVPYMSPEQVSAGSVDAASDIFSFGSVLYEMVTGERPFAAPTAAETMVAILKQDPPSPSGSASGIPQSLWRVILHCLEKSPEARFLSAGDLAFALRAVERDVSPQTIQSPVPSAKSEPSIAVLPFLDMSAEKDQEYFCDGLAEELITALAKLEGLHVASRTSAFQFHGKGQDIRKVGEFLNVETVLEGSVRKAGDRLRITAQLVKVTDGYFMWSAKYDRQMADVFAIQEEIARSIVDTLKVRLLRDYAPLIERHTDDEEAYNLYLKGRYFWNKRYQVGLQKGIDYFRQAIEADPGYALAYAGRADSYAMLGFYGNMPPQEAAALSKIAAQKALQLDASIAESHTSLGFVHTWFDWNWPLAEREFRRSIELNPRYYWAHFWYGLSLAASGRHAEAEIETKRALELDPLSHVLGPGLGFVYQMGRRYDEAIEECRRTLDLEPNSLLALWIIGISFCHKSMYAEGIAALQKAVHLTRDSYYVGHLAYCYAKSGDATAAKDLLTQLRSRAQSEYVAPVFFTWVYGALGELDLAFDYLGKAFAERHPLLAPLSEWEIYDSLRMDARFAEYASRVRPHAPAQGQVT